RAHDFRIAREVFILELHHVSVRREMTDSLEHRDRKIRSGHLEGETLANESGELGLMLECVNAGDDSSRAVSEQIYGQTGFARLGESDYGCDIADVVGEALYIEAFAVRAAA